MTQDLSSHIRDYIKKRESDKLALANKEAEKRLSTTESGALATDPDLLEKRAQIKAEHQVEGWLTKAAARAAQITFATHPVKFTHSDAKGSSIYAAYASDLGAALPYLSTACLREPAIDVDGNAAALDVAGLLQVESNGVSLLAQIADGDVSSLAPLAKNPEQLHGWQSGLERAVIQKAPSTHTLSKQVFFPVANSDYHLISPLFSSSLAQALFERINSSRFSDEAKALRELRRKKQHSTEATVEFRNLAIKKFGGTNTQNVSQLNNRRGGRTYLLSCQPPTWTAQAKPPATHYSFWKEYDRRAWRAANQLRLFLERSLTHSNTIQIRTERETRVDQLIEILIQYAAEIQTAGFTPGWSTTTNLRLSEQRWLDPLWLDQKALEAQTAVDDWRSEIAGLFAFWLNRKLQTNKLSLGDAEYHAWAKKMHDYLEV